MDEKLAKFFADEQKKMDEKLKNEKESLLRELQLYNIEYAPINSKCEGVSETDETVNTKLSFTLPNKVAKVGDKVNVKVHEQVKKVTITSVSYCEDLSQFSDETLNLNTSYDYQLGIERHFITNIIDITDEEYKKILQTDAAKKILDKPSSTASIDIPNTMRKKYCESDYVTLTSIVITGIGFAVYIIGFILGIVSGKTFEIPNDYLSSHSSYQSEFNIIIMFVIWVASFISGSLFIGFGRIIDLLQTLCGKASGIASTMQ